MDIKYHHLDINKEEWREMIKENEELDRDIIDDKTDIIYYISNFGRIKKESIKDESLTEYFMIPQFKHSDMRYSIRASKYRYRYLGITSLMKKYWPEIDFNQFDKKQLSREIKDRNPIDNKNAQKLYLGYIDRNKRNCASCGKPSDVNYWCNTCRKQKRDSTNNPYQWGPTETHSCIYLNQLTI